jgi:hypothetical protein
MGGLAAQGVEGGGAMSHDGQQRIRIRAVVNPVTGCWRWTGASRGVGYGAIKVDGRVIDAHRYSWLMFHGEIPGGKQVCHKCDNRACVNPDHLELGDHSTNRADAITRGGASARITRRRPLPAGQLERILSDYDGGVSVRQLCGKHGIPSTSLRRLLVTNGRKLPEGGK